MVNPVNNSRDDDVGGDEDERRSERNEYILVSHVVALYTSQEYSSDVV